MSHRRSRAIYVEQPAMPLLGRRYVVLCNCYETGEDPDARERYCQRVASGLASLGANITLLTSRPRARPRTEKAEFGRVVRVGRTGSHYPLALAWLILHLSEIDGVIDSSNGVPYFSPLVVGRRTPVVLVVHHVDPVQSRMRSTVARTLAGWLERCAVARVYRRRAVCTVSPSARAATRGHFKLRGPIYIAPNGLDLPETPETPERRRRPTVAYVGELEARKRVDILVRLVPRLVESFPDLTVDVVGDGGERQKLEALAHDLNVASAIVFHGRVCEHIRDELVSRAWCSIDPSVGEGRLSVMEAASLGVPTVGLPRPGRASSLGQGRSELLCGSEEDLGLVVVSAVEALRDLSVAERWSAACREWAAMHSWDRTAARVHAVLSSEADRLANRYEDRRHRNDTCTIVTLTADGVTAESLCSLRRTDQVRTCNGKLQLLLHHADEVDATRVLSRLGLRDRTTWTTRVARPADLVGWDPVGRVDEILGAGAAIEADDGMAAVMAVRTSNGRGDVTTPRDETHVS